MATREQLEKEIAELEKVVNKVGHKYGGKILMQIAGKKKQLFSMDKIASKI